MTQVEDVSAHFVARHRANRANWGAIARMAGVSEPSLRRRFDRDYQPVESAHTTTSPRDRMIAGLRGKGFGADAAVILARLWQANGARMQPRDLIVGLAGLALASNLVTDARRAAMRRGIAFADRAPGGHALTADGVVVLETLAGLRDASGRAVE